MSKSGDLKGSQKYVPDLLDIIDLFFFPPATTAAGGDVLMLVPPERGESDVTKHLSNRLSTTALMTDQETVATPLNPTAIAQLPACHPPLVFVISRNKYLSPEHFPRI